MLRGRSESDSVLPSGDSAYASTDPSCAGMLLERVILGALLTGLDNAVKRTTCESLVRTQVFLTPGGSSKSRWTHLCRSWTTVEARLATRAGAEPMSH